MRLDLPGEWYLLQRDGNLWVSRQVCCRHVAQIDVTGPLASVSDTPQSIFEDTRSQRRTTSTLLKGSMSDVMRDGDGTKLTSPPDRSCPASVRFIALEAIIRISLQEPRAERRDGRAFSWTASRRCAVLIARFRRTQSHCQEPR
jgi:hypothetical protein